MTNPWRLLRITDGTTDTDSGIRREVDLLARKSGFCCTEWRPRAAEPKGGGVWSDSALAGGRRLHVAKPQNVAETITLEVRDHDADALIREVRALRQLLESAREYWTTGWSTAPVWIEAQGVNEGETRYALIMDYRTPEDGDPYAQPFWQRILKSGFSEFDLVIEREPYWRNVEPGDSECAEIGAMQSFCYSYPLVFDGAAGFVTLNTPGALNNLPSTGDFTVDGWIKADGWGENNEGRIADKSGNATHGWYFYIDNVDGLAVWVDYAPDATSVTGTDDFTPDGEWHHVAMVWDQGTLTPTLYIDGNAPSQVQNAGGGAYDPDATDTLYIGNWAGGTRTWDGEIGWLRISDNERWTANFNPPPRCILPSRDANTIWLGIREGYGTTVYDLSTTGQDGTISLATWGDCCATYMGNYLATELRYMTFNATTSLVNCGTPGHLDDLPDADMTVDAWVRADGWGENNAGSIANKTDVRLNGFDFCIDSSLGLVAWLDHVTDATASAAAFVPDGAWHHVAMVWDQATLTVTLYIDGNAPTQAQVAGAGAYVSDAGEDLMIGNWFAATRTWDGDIQWVRVSTCQRFTHNFTDSIPERCVLPEVDAYTAGLWRYYDGATIRDETAYEQDGTPTAIGTGLDCGAIGREETCDEDTVYATNHHKQAQLTHVFYLDASGPTFSANLLTQPLPYPILPGAVTVSDCFYAGIDTSLSASTTGPFSSLVFDLASTGTGISFSYSANSVGTNQFWQYWSSTGVDHWEWLREQDNTNDDGSHNGEPFDTAGDGSVHWMLPSDWSVTTINGVQGYWVRCIVAGAATPTVPVQQNRHIYTISWPFIEVREGEVLGDVPLLVEQYLRNQSDRNKRLFNEPPYLYSTRVVVGLRSLSRGADFTPYINLSDEQNQSGITVLGTFVDDTVSPTGRICREQNIGADAQLIAVIFDIPLVQQYFGTFHCYLRAYQYSGAAGDLTLYWVGYQDIASGTAGITRLTDDVAFSTLTDFEVLDFGRITIPWQMHLRTSELRQFTLELWGDGDGAVDCYFYDLILMPVDEWAINAVLTNVSTASDSGAALGYRGSEAAGSVPRKSNYLDIDSVTLPKVAIRSVLKYWDSGYAQSGLQSLTPEPMIAQARRAQRYWFFHIDESETIGIGSRPEVSTSAQMFKVRRYISMRGAT